MVGQVPPLLHVWRLAGRDSAVLSRFDGHVTYEPTDLGPHEATLRLTADFGETVVAPPSGSAVYAPEVFGTMRQTSGAMDILFALDRRESMAAYDTADWKTPDIS